MRQGALRVRRRANRRQPSNDHQKTGGMDVSKQGGRPGVLLDRDGTIIVDSGYVSSVERVQFIDGAIEAIAALNRAGLPVAVVTNQSAVARGLCDIEDVQQVHKHMIAELARGGAHVDAWLFCPYHPEGSVEAFARVSADRKPGPGMALAAAEKLSLDLSVSWVVGDSDSDVGLARAVGARPLRVGVPSGSELGEPDVTGSRSHEQMTHMTTSRPPSSLQRSSAGVTAAARTRCLRHRVQRRAVRRSADRRPNPVPRGCGLDQRRARRALRPGRAPRSCACAPAARLLCRIVRGPPRIDW